jgi:hypothetical protein
MEGATSKFCKVLPERQGRSLDPMRETASNEHSCTFTKQVDQMSLKRAYAKAAKLKTSDMEHFFHNFEKVPHRHGRRLV